MQRFRVPLLIVLLVLLVAACGGGSESGGESTSTGAEDESGTETAATGEQNCDDADPVMLGALAPLTGPSADLGAQTEDGATLAVQELNANEGILGRCVELLLKDDEGDPTTATQAARELVDQEGVDAIIGPVLSSPTGAALEVTNAANVPENVISALAAAGDPETYPYSFMNEFTANQIVEAMVAYLQRQGYTSPGILAVNNALGTFLTDTFVSEIEGTEIELATDPVLHESGAADLTPQVRELTSADADVLIAFQAAGPDLSGGVRARNQLAPDIPVVGIGAMANVAATGALSPEQMEGVVAGPFFREFTYREGEETAVGEKAQEFLERYREFKGGELQESASQVASAYDAVNIAAAAAEGAGSFEAEAYREYLENNPYEGARGEYTWSADSHVGAPLSASVFVEAASLENGLLQLAPGEEAER